MNCVACTRENDLKRSYCGGCGAQLRLICGDCSFENTLDDCYCGGCGLQLQAHPAAPSIVATRGSQPVVGIVDELAALLSAPKVELETQLPQSGIVQSDVDRLFGVAP